jgi:hypothetical protein
MPKRHARPLSHKVAFHLGDAGEHEEEEAPDGAAGVDSLAAEIDKVERDAPSLPLVRDLQTIRGVSKEPIELDGDDAGDSALRHQLQKPAAARSQLQRLRRAHARVDVDGG